MSCAFSRAAAWIDGERTTLYKCEELSVSSGEGERKRERERYGTPRLPAKDEGGSEERFCSLFTRFRVVTVKQSGYAPGGKAMRNLE